MKILLINDYWEGGGAESVFRQQFRLFSERHYVECFYASETIAGAGISPFGYLYSFHYRRKLKAFLSTRRFDCIIVHNYCNLLSPSLLDVLEKYKQEENCLVLYYAHDYHLACPNRGYTYYRKGERHNFEHPPGIKEILRLGLDHRGGVYSLLKKAQWVLAYTIRQRQRVFDRILVPSEFLGKQLKESHPDLWVETVYNPCEWLDTLQEDVRGLPDTLQKERTTLSLVYFGRLDPVKGLREFLGKLSGTTIDYTLTIIGEGPEAKVLQAVALQPPWKGRVFLKPFMKPEALVKELKKHDVFVLPALWYENAPLSVIEAASLGLGLLLSGHGGIREMGELCGARYFFDPFDAGDLLSTLDSLYSDFRKGVLPAIDSEQLKKRFSKEVYMKKMEKVLKKPIELVYLLPGGLFNPGGIERIVIAKANYLAEKAGYKVSIVTTEQMGRPVFYPVSEKVSLRHLDIGIHEKYGQESYPRKCISRYRKARQYRKALSRLLHEIRPDITISTLGLDIDFLETLRDGSIKMAELHYPGNFRELSAAKLSKAFLPNLVAGVRSRRLRKNCSRLSRLVVLTEEEKAGWDDQKNLRVIPNMLPFVPESRATGEAKQVIAIGRLAYEKGFDLLIDAWKSVYEKHPDWQLHIYGQGGLRETLEQQIRSNGLSDVVRICHPVSDIAAVYPLYSILVLPSRFLEALPMVLIEALSVGLPLVAFDSPCGPKDVIEEGKNGFLVPTGETEKLAERIGKLIASEALRKQMSREAVDSSRRYDEEKIMGSWLDLFNELVEEKRIENTSKQ